MRDLWLPTMLSLLAACAGATSPPPERGGRSSGLDESSGQSPQVAAGTWLPWRPCGCFEGCALVEEERGALREGLGVTIVRANVRSAARPVEAGTFARVVRSDTTDGAPTLALDFGGDPTPDGDPGPVVCGYLCETRFSGPLPADVCEDPSRVALP